MAHESVFALEATPVKFGPGASAEAGWELKRLGVRRAMHVTDPRVGGLDAVQRIRRAIEVEGIDLVVYDRAHVEPTLDSVQAAAEFARDHEPDGFVSIGGGSSMDTAKVANLVLSHPAPVMAYVNAPISEGRA